MSGSQEASLFRLRVSLTGGLKAINENLDHGDVSIPRVIYIPFVVGKLKLVDALKFLKLNFFKERAHLIFKDNGETRDDISIMVGGTPIDQYEFEDPLEDHVTIEFESSSVYRIALKEAGFDVPDSNSDAEVDDSTSSDKENEGDRSQQ